MHTQCGISSQEPTTSSQGQHSLNVLRPLTSSLTVTQILQTIKPPQPRKLVTMTHPTPLNEASHSRSSEVPLRYGLLLFPQWELLDAAGPIEALNSLTHSPAFPYASDLDFCIIAETLDPVSTGPLKDDPKPFNRAVAQSVVPTHTFDNAPDIDVLIIPGGFGTGPSAIHRSGFDPNVDAVVDYIAKVYDRVEYIISMSFPNPTSLKPLLKEYDSCVHRVRTHCTCWTP